MPAPRARSAHSTTSETLPRAASPTPTRRASSAIRSPLSTTHQIRARKRLRLAEPATLRRERLLLMFRPIFPEFEDDKLAFLAELVDPRLVEVIGIEHLVDVVDESVLEDLEEVDVGRAVRDCPIAPDQFLIPFLALTAIAVRFRV